MILMKELKFEERETYPAHSYYVKPKCQSKVKRTFENEMIIDLTIDKF